MPKAAACQGRGAPSGGIARAADLWNKGEGRETQLKWRRDGTMRKILVGISGASGMPLALRLLGHLAAMPDVDLSCVVSDGAAAVLDAECGLAPDAFTRHARHVYPADDLGAGPASGSWWHGEGGQAAMLVVPCSMGTLGALASGATRNLLQRAADVALKESLRLVLVTRESPLSAIHLRNMLALREAGAVIMPFSPGFYLRPQSLEAMLDHFCGRILDQAGLPHRLGRWAPGTATPCPIIQGDQP